MIKEAIVIGNKLYKGGKGISRNAKNIGKGIAKAEQRRPAPKMQPSAPVKEPTRKQGLAAAAKMAGVNPETASKINARNARQRNKIQRRAATPAPSTLPPSANVGIKKRTGYMTKNYQNKRVKQPRQTKKV